VLEEDFAAILLDVRMPGIDGFTTAKMIRERKRSRYTPIIFMTAAQEDLSSMFKGYRSGAIDYIVKPIIPDVLRTKLSFFIGLHDINKILSAELAERTLTEQRLRTSEESLRNLAKHLSRCARTSASASPARSTTSSARRSRASSSTSRTSPSASRRIRRKCARRSSWC